MLSTGLFLRKAQATLPVAAPLVSALKGQYHTSPYHQVTFRPVRTPSQASVERRAKRMEGSSFTSEQFARTRKPFDMPVFTKSPIGQRRQSARAAIADVRARELRTLRKNPAEIDSFKVGDRIAVTHLLSLREDKLQTVKGVVIAKRRREYIDASFSILNSVDGVQVELAFPLHSPFLRKIEVIDRLAERGITNTQRKLYYFRDLPTGDRRARPIL